MKRLPIILSAVYWLVVAAVLWLGYQGDAQIDRASAVPVTHSAGFDTGAGFVLALVVYLLACGVWWGVLTLRRKAA